jgi:hypothetical protein
MEHPLTQIHNQTLLRRKVQTIKEQTWTMNIILET